MMAGSQEQQAQEQQQALAALAPEEREEEAARFNILDVFEGISAHFHEHHDVIMTWSWKLLCAKWGRMLDQVSAREAKRLAQEEARKEEETLRELMAASRAQAGWG